MHGAAGGRRCVDFAVAIAVATIAACSAAFVSNDYPIRESHPVARSLRRRKTVQSILPHHHCHPLDLSADSAGIRSEKACPCFCLTKIDFQTSGTWTLSDL